MRHRPRVYWAMPTVRGVAGPYRFFFYSFDYNERPHVHARRDRAVCKFWLHPLALARNHGFSARELNEIRAIMTKEGTKIEEAWFEHCGEH